MAFIPAALCNLAEAKRQTQTEWPTVQPITSQAAPHLRCQLVHPHIVAQGQPPLVDVHPQDLLAALQRKGGKQQAACSVSASSSVRCLNLLSATICRTATESFAIKH